MPLKTIAVVTSGGDAPGMNAAIRAVVRTGVFYGLRVLAVNQGYEGLIDGNFSEMNAGDVSNIIQKGGTIIKTSRSKRFEKYEGRKNAYRQIKKAGIDALIVIGGNGSIAGASTFISEFEVPIIAIPKTIDNDIYGTDYAIGFDTAINTALDAIDKIRDTADSHHRLFFVEVMGRDLGFIALNSGISSGAEAILIPEVKTNINDVMLHLERGWKRHKSSLIVVVAEGSIKGGVMAIAKKIKEKFDHYDIRVSILGHIQRGGSPSCMDRMLASRFGYHAVKAVLNGKKNVMVGILENKIVFTSLAEASAEMHDIDKELLEMAEVLAT